MKKEIADKWVKALRSGEYKQCEGALRNYNASYYCLGVLCEISSLDKWIESEIFDDECGENTENENDFYLGKDELLPREVMRWSDMKSNNGIFKGDDLASLNDSGITFNEIADIIEEHWEEL